jgi:hypothetical protein
MVNFYLRYAYVAGQFQWTCIEPSDCVDPRAYLSPSISNTFGLIPKPFQIRSSVTFVKVEKTASKLYVPPGNYLIKFKLLDLLIHFQMMFGTHLIFLINKYGVLKSVY